MLSIITRSLSVKASVAVSKTTSKANTANSSLGSAACRCGDNANPAAHPTSMPRELTSLAKAIVLNNEASLAFTMLQKSL